MSKTQLRHRENGRWFEIILIHIANDWWSSPIFKHIFSSFVCDAANLAAGVGMKSSVEARSSLAHIFACRWKADMIKRSFCCPFVASRSCATSMMEETMSDSRDRLLSRAAIFEFSFEIVESLAVSS
jgi:hypothetical protein